MTKLSHSIMSLLDRLYNLKNEDENVLIQSIKSKIDQINKELAENSERQSNNEIERIETQSKLEIFTTQKDAFCSAFATLNDDTFEALRAIGVNLEIGKMLTTIDEKAPGYYDELLRKIEEAGAEIIACKEKNENLVQKLNYNKLELETSISNAKELKVLLETCLSSDGEARETLSTKQVKEVLSKFETFNEDEVSLLAKLVLFPEDGLIEYDENYDERVKSGFIEETTDDIEEDSNEASEEKVEEAYNEENSRVIEEKVEESYSDEIKESHNEVEEEPTKEEIEEASKLADLKELLETNLGLIEEIKDEHIEAPIDEPVKEIEEEKDETENEDEDETSSSIPLPEEPKLEINDEKHEITQVFSIDELNVLNNGSREYNENEENNSPSLDKKEFVEENEEDFAELLSNIGLSLDKLKENNSMAIDDVYELLKRVEFKIIENNYEILRSIDAKDKAVYKIHTNNHSYLTDLDLNKKITLLRAKGVSESTIRNLLEEEESGLREEYKTFESRVNAIESVSEKIDDDTISLLKVDVVKYEKNLKKLEEYGYELDDKEKRNHQAVLFRSKYIDEDVEILKNYLIGLQRKNNKYALAAFWKSPKELLFDINDIIEANLEELLVSHPEILVNSVDSLLARIRYCKENGKPLFKKDESSYSKTIREGLRFYNEYNTNAKEYIPRSRIDVNDSLAKIIGNPNYVEKLINKLDEYYKKTTTFKDIALTGTAEKVYEDLLDKLEENFKAELIGPHTYQINGVSISKNKLERNLAYLIDSSVAHNEIVTGVEREILLVSALYNLRVDDINLKKVVDSYVGGIGI